MANADNDPRLTALPILRQRLCDSCMDLDSESTAVPVGANVMDLAHAINGNGTWDDVDYGPGS